MRLVYCWPRGSALLPKVLGRYADSVLTVSRLFVRRLRARDVSLLAAVNRPYVDADRAGRLAAVNPAYGDDEAILVYAGRGHKGVELP